MSNTNSRVFGLDLLRALAIVLVVIGHTNSWTEAYFDVNVPDGVTLFFVLSGYLVGTIIIREFQSSNSFRTLINFWQRRWLRTLPNYYLALLLNIILIQLGWLKGVTNIYSSAYFVFMQNFHLPLDFMFWESWSLAVEEWFYLTLPFLLFGLLKLLKLSFKNTILIVIMGFVICPLLYRILHFVPNISNVTWDIWIRKLVLTRIDSIGFGVLAAYIHFYFPKQWKKNTISLFFIGGSIYTLFYLFIPPKSSYFMQTFYFSVISAAIALCIPYLSKINLDGGIQVPITFLSKISYSMYLIHIPVLQNFERLLPFNVMKDVLLFYPLYWVVIIICSYLLYRFFELPTTKLREKITSKLSEKSNEKYV